MLDGLAHLSLVLAPIAKEREHLATAFGSLHPVEPLEGLRMPCDLIRPWRTLLATGGLGKAQFAIQTQYLIDRFPSARLVICAGAAGSLAASLSTGDVVVGTETVEHDFRSAFALRPLPRFSGQASAIEALREVAREVAEFKVVFDVIASGDEDVVSAERATAIRDETGAVCVAWKGSGAARAAAFNGLGSIELRAITDAADEEAPQAFAAHLARAIGNLAILLTRFLDATNGAAWQVDTD